MGLDAYRVTELKYEEPSFSLWHNEKLMDFLNQEVRFYTSLSPEGGGLVVVPVYVLESTIEMAAELELDEDTIENIRNDIAAAKSDRNETITYYCH